MKPFVDLGIAISSDSGDEGVSITQASLGISTQSFTAICWHANTVANYGTLFSFDDGATGHFVRLNYDPNARKLYVSSAGHSDLYIESSGDLGVGVWHMGALVGNGSTFTGYAIQQPNRVLQLASGTNTPQDTGMNLTFGNTFDRINELGGTLAGCIVYGWPLTPAQILMQSRQLAPRLPGALSCLPMKNVPTVLTDKRGRRWSNLAIAIFQPRNVGGGGGTWRPPVPEVFSTIAPFFSSSAPIVASDLIPMIGGGRDPRNSVLFGL
jgi:hypothetical protein